MRFVFSIPEPLLWIGGTLSALLAIHLIMKVIYPPN